MCWWCRGGEVKIMVAAEVEGLFVLQEGLLVGQEGIVMIESGVGCERIEEHVAVAGGLDTSDVCGYLRRGRGGVDHFDGF